MLNVSLSNHLLLSYLSATLIWFSHVQVEMISVLISLNVAPQTNYSTFFRGLLSSAAFTRHCCCCCWLVPPKTSISHEYISVSLGDELDIDCIIEAFPKANSYWSKKALSLSSLQQNDRGYWADGSRWLQISGASRAPSYRAKQILLPTEGTSAFIEQEIGNSNRTSPADSQIELEVAKRATSSSDDSLTRKQGAPDMSVAGRRHLISSLGGNFRWSSGGSTQAPVAAIGTEQTPASTSSKAYVTVRQTPLNTFTYKLRLSIAQMQPDDYGEYICISTNSMGSSKSKVTVTSEYS